MCMSAPKMPEMPDAAPLPSPPPAAPPMQRQPEATPAPTTNKDEAPKLKTKRTKRSQMQQAASGMSSLRIPLNTGGSTGGTGLNIPK